MRFSKNGRLGYARFIQKIQKNARFDIARKVVIEESVSQKDQVWEVQMPFSKAAVSYITNQQDLENKNIMQRYLSKKI